MLTELLRAGRTGLWRAMRARAVLLAAAGKAVFGFAGARLFGNSEMVAGYETVRLTALVCGVALELPAAPIAVV
jgi:hypothetical protein